MFVSGLCPDDADPYPLLPIPYPNSLQQRVPRQAFGRSVQSGLFRRVGDEPEAAFQGVAACIGSLVEEIVRFFIAQQTEQSDRDHPGRDALVPEKLCIPWRGAFVGEHEEGAVRRAGAAPETEVVPVRPQGADEGAVEQPGIDLVQRLAVEDAEALGVGFLEIEVGLEMSRFQQPLEAFVPVQPHERSEFLAVIQARPDEMAGEVAEEQVIESVGHGVGIEQPVEAGLPVMHDALQGGLAAAVPGDGAGRFEEVLVQVGHVEPGRKADRVPAGIQGILEVAVHGAGGAETGEPVRRRPAQAVRDGQGPGFESHATRKRCAPGVAGSRGHGPQEVHSKLGKEFRETGNMLVSPQDEVPYAA